MNKDDVLWSAIAWRIAKPLMSSNYYDTNYPFDGINAITRMMDSVQQQFLLEFEDEIQRYNYQMQIQNDVYSIAAYMQNQMSDLLELSIRLRPYMSNFSANLNYFNKHKHLGTSSQQPSDPLVQNAPRHQILSYLAQIRITLQADGDS